MMAGRLLDLFCGAGGAGMGYYRAGFDEIVGVDIAPQPDYPFDFIRCDVFELRMNLAKFDLIHASPPCQGYTTMNNRHGSSVPRLIGPVRDMLLASGKPYIMENVDGAKRAMIDPIRLTGEMFGLRVHRPRLFESNLPLVAPAKVRRQRDPVAIYGACDGRLLYRRRDGSELRVSDLETARAAMEMPWADWHGVKEAVPPAYTEYLGRQAIDFLRLGAVS